MHIHTLPLEAMWWFRTVKGLRGMGVTVAYNDKVHEKVAIIDERMLWHGSLSILSHSNKPESMLCIVSPLFCEEVARNLAAHEENPPCPKCGTETQRMRHHKTGRTFFRCLKCGATFDRRNARRRGRP